MKWNFTDHLPLLAVIIALGLVSIVAHAARSNSPVSVDKITPMQANSCTPSPSPPGNE